MSYKVLIDMTGVRCGRLIGLACSHRSPSGHAHWLFACDCWAEVVVNGANVRVGDTTSCGCTHREISSARLLVHGRRAAARHDPTYRTWQTMNADCTNPGRVWLPALRSPGGERVRGVARRLPAVPVGFGRAPGWPSCVGSTTPQTSLRSTASGLRLGPARLAPSRVGDDGRAQAATIGATRPMRPRAEPHRPTLPPGSTPDPALQPTLRR